MRVHILRTAAVAAMALLASATLSMAQGWVKDPKTGCSIWTNAADRASWNGACSGGKASGKGTATYERGGKPLGTYDGALKNGKMDGKGTLTYASGDRYVGQFKDGKRNGQGMYTYANGTHFEGAWKDDGFLGK